MASTPLDAPNDLDLEEAIELVAARTLATANVAIPATIESFDTSTGLARVQPSIRVSAADGEASRLPPISNVPVLQPSGGGFVATFPLQRGDRVWLVFNDRSLDEWNNGGGLDVTPRSKRRFAITDAVALLGGRPKTAPLKTLSTTALVIGEEEGEAPLRIVIDRGAPPSITRGFRIGDGVNDLFDAVAELAAVVKTATFGPYAASPAVIAACDAITAKIDAIRKA